ncbi:MAG: hypothetical protein MZV65_38635 [Chromatiales bacterium]|nr:hypothetical protein [Chromatiales bacterium]
MIIRVAGMRHWRMVEGQAFSMRFTKAYSTMVGYSIGTLFLVVLATVSPNGTSKHFIFLSTFDSFTPVRPARIMQLFRLAEQHDPVM